jgi:hypothetical protein
MKSRGGSEPLLTSCAARPPLLAAARSPARPSQLKTRTEQLAQQLEEAEQTQSTLSHMLKRSQDEKLSHLATLKAFEDSIRVHRNEQELSEGVLRQVQKSRDEETSELHKMQLEVRKHLALLDRKLEARRLEVRARQEKAKWRLAKLQEEMQLKAQAEGDMTEAEEREMIEKAKNLQQEASDLRAEKIRTMAEADAAEAEFHRVRFAAGVPGPGPDQHVAEEGAPFVPPVPEPIIQRFAKLEDEVNQIEEQLADYSQRQAVLQQQQAALRAQNQPRAKDRQDEEDVDVALAGRLSERTGVGKRALETATRELDSARGLKLQLDQSISVLRERVEMLALPEGAAGAAAAAAAAALPELAESESISSALLAADFAELPSAWSRQVQKKTLDATQRLQELMRAIDVQAAASAMRAATAYLQNSAAGGPPAALGGSGGGGGAGAESASSSLVARAGSDGGSGEGGADGERSASDTAAAAGEAAAALADENESDRRLEATIESLIVKNEWSIRVRPSSSNNSSRPVKTISGKVLNEAVQAFEKTWKDVGSGALSAAAVAAAARDVPGSAGGLGLSGGGGGEDGLHPAPPTAEEEKAAEGGDKAKAKAAKAKEPVDVNKPKARDVQKFLATAAAMAGDEVDESLVSWKKDFDEVPTRERIKRTLAVDPKAAKGAKAAK